MNCVTKASLFLDPIICKSGNALASVPSLRLLGVIFSADLTWNEHVKYTITKCYKRLFILRNLKRVNCPSHIIKNCYVTFIRSVLLYGYPSFCNLPNYLFSKLSRVERIAGRYFSSAQTCPLLSSANAMCLKLFTHITNVDNHPLRIMFQKRLPTPRNNAVLKPPFASSKRFSNSFIRFGK